MLRRRDSHKIRTDAIKMAVEKSEKGCVSCVQTYLSLAKENGASNEEIQQTIELVSETEVNGISRRNIIKLAVIAATGVVVGSAGLEIPVAEAYSSYWGTDTNTSTCCGIPQNYYLGSFGGGLTGLNNFSVNGATMAGFSFTYEYWAVEGPGSPNRGGRTAFDWGVAQASAAAYQWYNNGNAGYVGGTTIFGDIENLNPGWGSNQSDNRSVLEGFLYQIAQYNNGHFNPGLYISVLNWSNYFGTGYTPGRPFVLWITGCKTSFVTSPCSSGSSAMSQINNLLPTIKNIRLGGMVPVLWQWWIPAQFCNNDFDVATQSGNGHFNAETGSPNYLCSGCGVTGCL